jgi:hypothetical protein
MYATDQLDICGVAGTGSAQEDASRPGRDCSNPRSLTYSVMSPAVLSRRGPRMTEFVLLSAGIGKSNERFVY